MWKGFAYCVVKEIFSAKWLVRFSYNVSNFTGIRGGSQQSCAAGSGGILLRLTIGIGINSLKFQLVQWWRLPQPEERTLGLSAIIDFSLPCQDAKTSRKNLEMILPAHIRRLREIGLSVTPGCKCMRHKKPVLELRFNDVAGCLRASLGASSRQYLVVKQGTWRTGILSPRAAVRLMGAPEFFNLPGVLTDTKLWVMP